MKKRIILGLAFSVFLLVILNMLIPGVVYLAFYENTPVLLVARGLTDIFITIFIVFCYCLINKETIGSVGFYKKKWGKNLFSGGMLGLLSVSLGTIIILLTKSMGLETAPISWLYIVTSFVMICLSAISEDIFFRGFMQNQLTRITKPYIAVIISSIIFTLLHLFNPEVSFLLIVNIFIAGTLIGLSFLYTKNLLFPIGFHIFWNFTQSVFGFNISGFGFPSIFSLKLSSNTIINGGKAGFEGSIICTLILLCLNIFFYYKIEKGLTQYKKSEYGSIMGHSEN
jgi:membrane protease YdiL (CAAX protease family)